MITLPDNKRESIAADLMPDLTPLLDVMFMLIVFFILTANTVPFALDVHLPEDRDAVTHALEDTDVISVSLLPDDAGWKINDVLYESESAFKATLAEQHKSSPDKNLIIIGDRAVSMEKLLDLLTFLRKNEIPAADIIMEKP
jgi:biopolymer transport protein ExbD